MSQNITPIFRRSGPSFSAMKGLKIKGLINPTQLRSMGENKLVVDLYSSLYMCCYYGQVLELTERIPDFCALFRGNGLTLNRTIRKSLASMLNYLSSECVGILVDNSTPEISYTGQLLDSFAFVFHIQEYTIEAVRLLGNAVALKDDHSLALLESFLETGVELNYTERHLISMYYRKIGRWFLEDGDIIDPLDHIIALANLFYFGIYDIKTSEILLEGIKRLFDGGRKALAVEHCLSVWRNVYRKSDRDAMRIAAAVRKSLLERFGEPGALDAALGSRSKCLEFGISEESADLVPELVRNILSDVGAEATADAFSIVGRNGGRRRDAAVRDLLDGALSGDRGVRSKSLRAAEKIIRDRAALRLDKGTTKSIHEERLKVFRELTRPFSEKKYAPIAAELETVELKLLGDIIKSMSNREGVLVGLFYIAIGEAVNGDTYLARKIFSAHDRMLRRGTQLKVAEAFAHVFYSLMSLDKSAELKAFAKAVDLPNYFYQFLKMRNDFADNLFQKNNLEAAFHLFRRWGEGEPRDSFFYQDYLFHTGLLHFTSGDVDSALKWLNEIIESNPASGETAFYLARAHHFIGNIHFHRDEEEKAVEHWELSVKILEENPEHGAAADCYLSHLVNLAAGKLSLEEFDEAERFVLKTVEEAERAEKGIFFFSMNAFLLYMQTGRFQDALGIIRRFMKKNRKFREALNDSTLFEALIGLYLEVKDNKGLSQDVLKLLRSISPGRKAFLAKAVEEFSRAESSLPPEILDLQSRG